jgi:ubiquinone/menaquinone biosynthesis C-methylase UbiE
LGEKYGFEISSTEVLSFEVLKTLTCKNVPLTFFLIDCEKVKDKYYAFDILNYCYFKIDKKDLKIRYDHLKRLVSGTKLENELKLKQMRMGYANIVEEVKKVYANKYDYNIDGIIFTPLNASYKDRSLPVLKWKPIKDLTIDFLVKVGKEVELYCKDNGPKLFDKVPLTTFSKKERDEMNNKIVELSFDKQWKFYRIREDKTKEYETSKEFTGPNYCGVCNSTKNLINNPININNLNKNVYYKNTNVSHMTKMKKYNNRIKSYMINKYVDSGVKVLDIAGGRGGDLMKYEKRKVGEILLLNIDEGGLAEAKRRFPRMSFRTQLGNAREKLKIEGEFEVVSIQFAIHYMLGSKKTWDNFFKNIDGVLKKGGIFMCSFLDGGSVYQVLEKTGEIDYLGDNNKSSIFKLEKLYEGKMKDLGQEIKVISENFGEMNEYLVNVDFVTKYFEKKGYELLEDKFFKEIEETTSLSKGEQGYADLERFLVLRKK